MDVFLFDTGHIIRPKTMTTALVLIIPRLAPARSITQPIRRNSPLLEGSWPSSVSTFFGLAFTRSQRLKAITTSSLICNLPRHSTRCGVYVVDLVGDDNVMFAVDVEAGVSVRSLQYS